MFGWEALRKWLCFLPPRLWLSRVLAKYLAVLAAQGWAVVYPGQCSPGWLTQEGFSLLWQRRRSTSVLHLFELSSGRYQMARLPPALICVKTEWESSQAFLTWELFVYAGASLPDFSAWEARQGEVCAAQQQFELSGSKVFGRTLVSFWAMFIMPADVLRGPSALQCWVMSTLTMKIEGA